MKGPGVRNTVLLSIARPFCYGWLQLPYLSQKLPSAERWFTSLKICTCLSFPHNGCQVTPYPSPNVTLFQSERCFQQKTCYTFA